MADADPNAPAFAELQSLLEKEQYRAAIKKADEILKSVRGDVDALRCKAFAFLRRSKFADAVSVTGGMVDEELKFYGAYAHYRLNHLSDALKQLPTRTSDKVAAVMELKGQILYKQGNFNQSKLTFEQCITQLNVESVDVKTNLLASLAASGTSHQMDAICQKYNISTEEGFEITFNQACNHIALGNYDTAKELLEVALRAGQESLLEEGLTQEEVDAELMPVTVQLSYVKSLSGTSEDSLQELESASVTPGIGASIKWVIENNLLAVKSLRFSEHPPKRLLYESAKKLEKMLAISPAPLLSPAQSVIVKCNQSLLLISLNHMDDARPLMEQLLDEHPDNETVRMTQAAMLAKENKLSDAGEILQKIVSTHKDLVLSPLLFRAQLLCAGGSTKEALKLLIDIQDESIKFMGSMVATKIALMEQVSDFSGCHQLLEGALNWWRQQELAQHHLSHVAIAWCLEKYSTIKLRQGDLPAAVEFCKQALDVEQDELRRQQIISKLARTVACSENLDDLDLASYLAEGPSLGAEDVDDLEGNINGTKRGEVSSKKRQQASENGQVKRRRRKPRYPKGFDPEKPGPMPDSERWLPKWQRSGYKRRTHRSKKDGVKGSQGAGKVDESLDGAVNRSEPSTSKPLKSSERSGPRRKGPHRR